MLQEIMMAFTCSKFYCFWFLKVTTLFGYVCVCVRQIEPKEISLKDLGFTRGKDHISQLDTILSLNSKELWGRKAEIKR